MDIYDPEDFIAAVKKRPLLYDRYDDNYKDRKAKYSGWMQVAQEVTENWNELEVKDKELRAREAQSKWRNMRDNFRREISLKERRKKEEKSAKIYMKKKTKYRYFQQLLFLLPQFQNKDNNSKFKKSVTKHNDEDVSENSKTSNQRSGRRHTGFRNAPNKIRRTQESTVNITRSKAAKSRTDENEVRDFCRSLVPSLSKLDDEDRLSAKIEILNVISIFSTPKHLRNNTTNEIQTFNTYQQSSNMESIHNQINPLSPLQSTQESPAQNVALTASTSVLPYSISISHIKSDTNDD